MSQVILTLRGFLVFVKCQNVKSKAMVIATASYEILRKNFLMKQKFYIPQRIRHSNFELKLAAILEFLFAIQNIWKNRFMTKQSKMKLYKVCVKLIPRGTRTDITKTKNIKSHRDEDIKIN